jgi:hypothetical protein
MSRSSDGADAAHGVRQALLQWGAAEAAGHAAAGNEALEPRLVLGRGATQELDPLRVGGLYFGLEVVVLAQVASISCTCPLPIKLVEMGLDLDERCVIVVRHHGFPRGLGCSLPCFYGFVANDRSPDDAVTRSECVPTRLAPSLPLGRLAFLRLPRSPRRLMLHVNDRADIAAPTVSTAQPFEKLDNRAGPIDTLRCACAGGCISRCCTRS